MGKSAVYLALMVELNFHVEEVNLRQQGGKKSFMDLYYHLAQSYGKWVVPLRLLHNELINPKKNPFLKKVPHNFYLVKQGGEVKGRFALFGPGHWKENPVIGSFGFVDFTRDSGTAVLKELKEQARQRGIKELIGPLNPGIHNDLGILSDGFDQRNSFLLNYNPPYYTQAFSGLGFQMIRQFGTWTLYREDFHQKNMLQPLVEYARRKKGLTIRKSDLRQFNKELKIFYELYNQSFATHWGFQKASWEEFCFLAGDLKSLIKAEMALVAEWEGRPVGFVLGVPDLNELLKSNKSGRLGLRTLFRLLFGRKDIKSARVMIAGVLPEYRFHGIHLVLFYNIARNIFELGYEGGEIGWVMEGNTPVENTLRRMGAKRSKTYNLYRINL